MQQIIDRSSTSPREEISLLEEWHQMRSRLGSRWRLQRPSAQLDALTAVRLALAVAWPRIAWPKRCFRQLKGGRYAATASLPQRAQSDASRSTLTHFRLRSWKWERAAQLRSRLPFGGFGAEASSGFRAQTRDFECALPAYRSRAWLAAPASRYLAGSANTNRWTFKALAIMAVKASVPCNFWFFFSAESGSTVPGNCLGPKDDEEHTKEIRTTISVQ